LHLLTFFENEQRQKYALQLKQNHIETENYFGSNSHHLICRFDTFFRLLSDELES